MRLEFLFLDKTCKDGLEKFSFRHEITHKNKPSEYIDAQVSFFDFEGTDKWTIKIEISGENELNAKLLSQIYEQHIKPHNPIVLVNESSAYFNQTMYPLVNEFERKLREFLYLRMALHTGDKPKKVVEKLEEKDFGEIFNLLFVDEDFNKQYKALVNKRTSSKSYFVNELAGLAEKTTWDLLVGTTSDDYVRAHFLELTDYRNDVMHAHNISYETYKTQKKSFSRAIKFLNSEIVKILTYTTTQEESETAVDTLYGKLVSIGEGIVKAVDLTQKLATLSVSPEKVEQINKFLTLFEQLAINPPEEEKDDSPDTGVNH